MSLTVRLIDQPNKNLGSFALAFGLFAGVALLVMGMAKMVRRGDRPRHRRFRAIAYLVLGALLVALPIMARNTWYRQAAENNPIADSF